MKLDRRTLLVGGGAGAGLVVAFALWPRGLATDLAPSAREQAFGNFIMVGADGRVTVAVPQVETGQGIWTALPQIVADELGAAWETVAVEPAPLTDHYPNPFVGDGKLRITANSTSVRAFEEPLRRAAAVARTMLVGAAADRWNIDPAEIETADGLVINGVRTFTFGELAQEAAERTPPRDPPLRDTTKRRLTGQSLQRLDGPAKANGSWRFAGDVRLPSMLFAAARMAPPGGRLRGYSRDAITSHRGVRHIAARDQWIAVVADNWWQAERALKDSSPVFTGGRTHAEPRALYEDALANGDPRTSFSRGDYAEATRGSRPLAATYYVEPSQHLGLEPLSATARGRSETWAATQAPGGSVAYPMPPGEPAGRALEADAAPIAAALTNAVGRPVQVLLSHSASQNHDRVAPGALARMTALPGTGGITAAWSMRLATDDGFGGALERLGMGRHEDALDGAAPPYSIPNVRIEAITAKLPFEAGYMRGSPDRELAFFTESFIDELAHAGGLEPLAFRMSMLGGNGRLARCLQGAARLAQWDGGTPGSTMGIAGASAYGSHIGLVASATISEDQRVKVHRLIAAVDCGRVINPGLVTQQVEAGLVWALAQATIPSPQWAAAMPRARPWSAVRLPRLGDTPEINVQIIPSSDRPGGVSGLGTVALAPAVANAIYAGSGKRMRALPFDPVSGA